MRLAGDERELTGDLEVELAPRPAVDAAVYFDVTESCIRERVKAGELEAIQLGKYHLIASVSIRELVQRERAKIRFERDQAADVIPADIYDDIAELVTRKASTRTRLASLPEDEDGEGA